MESKITQKTTPNGSGASLSSNAVNSSRYSEVDEIKENLEALKENVVELTQHIRKDGAKQTAKYYEKAKESWNSIKAANHEQFEKLENQVKAKPSQSLAIAFGAGLVASMLLRRR